MTWCRCFFFHNHDSPNLSSFLVWSRSLRHRGRGSGGAVAGKPDQGPALTHHQPTPWRQHALPKVAPASARPAHLEQPSLWQAPSISHRPVNCPALKSDQLCEKKKNSCLLVLCPCHSRHTRRPLLWELDQVINKEGRHSQGPEFKLTPVVSGSPEWRDKRRRITKIKSVFFLGFKSRVKIRHWLLNYLLPGGFPEAVFPFWRAKRRLTRLSAPITACKANNSEADREEVLTSAPTWFFFLQFFHAMSCKQHFHASSKPLIWIRNIAIDRSNTQLEGSCVCACVEMTISYFHNMTPCGKSL